MLCVEYQGEITRYLDCHYNVNDIVYSVLTIILTIVQEFGVSNCCLTATQQLFSYIMVRTS